MVSSWIFFPTKKTSQQNNYFIILSGLRGRHSFTTWVLIFGLIPFWKWWDERKYGFERSFSGNRARWVQRVEPVFMTWCDGVSTQLCLCSVNGEWPSDMGSVGCLLGSFLNIKAQSFLLLYTYVRMFCFQVSFLQLGPGAANCSPQAKSASTHHCFVWTVSSLKWLKNTKIISWHMKITWNSNFTVHK